MDFNRNFQEMLIMSQGGDNYIWVMWGWQEGSELWQKQIFVLRLREKQHEHTGFKPGWENQGV